MTTPTQTPAQTQDPTQLLSKLAELTQSAEILKAENMALKTQLQASQTASTETQTKVAALEAQLAQVVGEKDSTAAELATTKNSIESLSGELTAATQTAGEAMQQLKVYKLLSSDPKYHAMLDIVDNLNLPADTDEAKALLDKLAGKFDDARNTGAQAAADAFKSVGALPNTSGAPSGDVSGPANANDAMRMAMDALGKGDYATFDSLSAQAVDLSKAN